MLEPYDFTTFFPVFFFFAKVYPANFFDIEIRKHKMDFSINFCYCIYPSTHSFCALASQWIRMTAQSFIFSSNKIFSNQSVWLLVICMEDSHDQNLWQSSVLVSCRHIAFNFTDRGHLLEHFLWKFLYLLGRLLFGISLEGWLYNKTCKEQSYHYGYR